MAAKSKLPYAAVLRCFLISCFISRIGLAISDDGQEQEHQMRVLALFSGAGEIGVDARLAKSVLRLAADRALQLHNTRVELLFREDNSPCDGTNKLPNIAAEEYFFAFSSCTSSSKSSSSSPSNNKQLATTYKCDKTLDEWRAQNTQDELAELDAHLSTATATRKRRWLTTASNNTSNQNSVVGPETQQKQQQQQEGAVNAIIGPSCDFLVDLVARMAAYWQVPVYSVSSVSAQFARKQVYRTLTRLSPSMDQLSAFFVAAMKMFNWRHLAVLLDERAAESRVMYTNLEASFSRTTHIHQIVTKLIEFEPLLDATTAPSSVHSNSYATPITESTDSVCDTETRRALNFARLVARVVLLLVSNPLQVRSILLCAAELGMGADYAYLAIDLGLRSVRPISIDDQGTTPNAAPDAAELSNNSQQKPGPQAVVGERTGQDYDWYSANDERHNVLARTMFESLLVFAVERPASDAYAAFAERAIDASTREHPNVRFDKTSVGAMVVALHDSLLLAAEAHSRASSSSATNNNIMNFAWNKSYAHGIGDELFVNELGDLELDYMLADLEPETGVMRPVARYSRRTRTIEPLPDAYVHWPRRQSSETLANLNNAASSSSLDGSPPPDMPACGFAGDAEHCVDRRNLHAALAVVGGGMVLVAAIALFSALKYRRIKLEMQLNDYWWRVAWAELQFVETHSGESLVSAISATLGGQRPAQSAAASSHTKKRLPKPKPVIGPTPLIVATSPEQQQEQDKLSQVGSLAGSAAMAAAAAVSVSGSLRQVRDSMALQSEYSAVFKSSALALYKSELVIVKLMNGKSISICRELLVELKSIRELCSENLAKFVGLCIEQDKLAIVYGFCSRGSLLSLLADERTEMNSLLKYSLIGDIVNGLHFIHTTQLNFHGRLKSANLLIDSRFTVKICDFGLHQLFSQLDLIDAEDDEIGDNTADNKKQQQNDDTMSFKSGHTQMSLGAEAPASVYNMDSVSVAGLRTAAGGASATSSAGRRRRHAGAARFFWTAPEHLRAAQPQYEASKKGDIYAFGVILSEIITRREPYFYGTNAALNWTEVRRAKKAHVTGGHFLATRGLGGSTEGGDRRESHLLMPGGHSGGGGSSVGSSIEAGTPTALSMQRRRASRVLSAIGRRNKKASASVAPDAADNELMAIAGCSDDGASSICSKLAPQNARHPPSPADILDQLRMGVVPTPVRPYVPRVTLEDVSPKIVDLMESCWAEEPAARPSIAQVRAALKRATKGLAAKNYLDNLLGKLQQYSQDLERIVDEKSADIVAEKDKADTVLCQLLPRFVADCVKRNEQLTPHQFDGVTVYFSDVVGFEKYASVLRPVELIDLINAIYSSLDSIVSSFDVVKIETIVDQFLIASGLSFERLAAAKAAAQPQLVATKEDEGEEEKHDDQGDHINGGTKRGKLKALVRSASSHKSPTPAGSLPGASIQGEVQTMDSSEQKKRDGAEQVARLALCVKDLFKSFNFRACLAPNSAATNAGSEAGNKPESCRLLAFNVRIGIHSGRVCAGIVGAKKPKYCLIGDTVNVASRMHTNSKANKIHISADTKLLLDKTPGFSIEPRGKIEIKGKGAMETFWLEAAF